MLELVSNIVITVSAALLFAYWFRWACLLIWSDGAALDHGSAKRRPPATAQARTSGDPAQERVPSKKFK